MPKRANGEGTLSRRKDKAGKTVGWKAAVVVGQNEDGTLDRRWISGKTQAEVQEKLRGFQADMHAGTVADTEGLTVTEFMTRWADHKEREGLKPNTVQSYRDTVRLYITPHIGAVKLEKLRPLDVERLLSRMQKSGKSAVNRRYALRILSMALRQAVRWQMLPRNVADVVSPPKAERPEMKVWTPEQVATFLDAAQVHRLYAAFYLSLMTGMRRGEVLGLQWADLDFERARLNVRNNLVEVHRDGVPGKTQAGKATVSSVSIELQTPKTAASKRTVALSPGTLSKLREHQARQAAEQSAAAEAWQGPGYVFASELGGPTNPNYFYDQFKKLAKGAGLPDIRLHDLRHTAASLMIRRGVSPKVVSDRLGHTDPAFTLRVYTHLYDEQREEAAFDLSDFFPVASGGPN
ncbi:site-specific integrase [Deinococcus sp.]|uniref:tyrosine-type recombinase/integrase n=1 Tax=Deinococcus sp. TaxID=47478 RepID=UPI0025EC2CD3|nr:site-specific integrase [Deinococcus sp.]